MPIWQFETDAVTCDAVTFPKVMYGSKHAGHPATFSLGLVTIDLCNIVAVTAHEAQHPVTAALLVHSTCCQLLLQPLNLGLTVLKLLAQAAGLQVQVLLPSCNLQMASPCASEGVLVHTLGCGRTRHPAALTQTAPAGQQQKH